MSFTFLTPYLLNGRLQSDLTKGLYKAWLAVATGRVPQYFPLKTATPFAPDREQILYVDRPRWTEKQLAEPPPSEKKEEKKEVEKKQ